MGAQGYDGGLDVIGIGLDGPEIVCERQAQLDRVAQERPAHQVGHRAHLFRDVHVLQLGFALPGESCRLRDELGSLIGRDKRRQQLALQDRLILQLARRRIDIGADHHQLVVEVVGDAVAQAIDGLRLLHAAQGLVLVRRGRFLESGKLAEGRQFGDRRVEGGDRHLVEHREIVGRAVVTLPKGLPDLPPDQQRSPGGEQKEQPCRGCNESGASDIGRHRQPETRHDQGAGQGQEGQLQRDGQQRNPLFENMN